jgi:hypothetical protein
MKVLTTVWRDRGILTGTEAGAQSDTDHPPAVPMSETAITLQR